MTNEWLENLKVFKNKVKDVSKKTGKNVSYVMSIKKTEIEITKVKHEIGKIFRAIGEVIYNCRDAEKDSSNIDILCKQIDVKKAYIKELEKRIELIKEKKRLEEFEVQVTNEIPSFIKVEETEYDDNNEIAVLNFCEDCNTGNELERTVCKKCGTKLKKKK